MSAADIARRLVGQLNNDRPVLDTWDRYFAGEQRAAFLSADAQQALDGKIKALGVNYAHLAVKALSERLRVTGFELGEEPDPLLRLAWRRNHLDQGHQQAHTDAGVYGRSFVFVWSGGDAAPLVTIESATQVAVDYDPATREIRSAVKAWVADDGTPYATVYEPDVITRLVGDAMATADNQHIPTEGWELRTDGRVDNPLGVIPVVPIVNRERLLDLHGTSEIAPIAELLDALAKLLADAMVSSEFYARPQRWATGLEITEDENGDPVDPFAGKQQGRVWQAETPDTKFGQFDPASLDGYQGMISTLTQQIGALTGLPPHYLGLHGDQPASADAIRSSESSLVAKALSRQRSYGQSWEQVARLVHAVADGTQLQPDLPVTVQWADPETRTPAQAADAVGKLVQVGVPLTVALSKHMQYSDEDIAQVRAARRTDVLDGQALRLPGGAA